MKKLSERLPKYGFEKTGQTGPSETCIIGSEIAFVYDENGEEWSRVFNDNDFIIDTLRFLHLSPPTAQG